MHNIGNYSPPGTPRNDSPTGTPPAQDGPQKTPRGIRATIYRAKTEFKRQFTGKKKDVKADDPKKSKKVKDDAKGQQLAPVPTNTDASPGEITEVHTHTHEVVTQVVTQYVYVPMPPVMAMPAPGNQDDVNYYNYLQQQQQQANLPQPTYTAVQPPVQYLPPVPAPAPVFVTTTQQHPFIPPQPPAPQLSPQPSVLLSMSQPAKVDDWNTRASNAMKQLVWSLETGDAKEVDSCFALMKQIAREQKFTDQEIDRWISAGTRFFSVGALRRAYKSAIELLDGGLLASSVWHGIGRLLAPQELISAIMEDHWGNALQFAKVIRDNCNPNKWGDKKPDEDQAREMMKEMLDKVVSQLVPRDIYILHMRVTGKSNLPAIRALDNLLLTKYSEAILRFENTADQKRIGELRSFKG